jgi:Reverse transcriptase (RNA-dependent DNA polymerase).
LEKVYDCISHSILLAKLEFYGIKDRTYSLIKSYLENKYQRVSVGNDSSNETLSPIAGK